MSQTQHDLVWSWQGVWQRTVKILVTAQSSAESQSTVMDSSRSSCTCHWLSSRLSEQGTRGDRRGGVRSVFMWICVCLGVGGYSGGPLIGMSKLHGVYVHERERGSAQSGAAERVSRCYRMSPRPTNLQERHNTSLDSLLLPALICLGCFYGSFGLWGKKSKVSQVKMSVHSSLTRVSPLGM